MTAVPVSQASPASPPVLAGCPMYPADNVWNVPIDTLPVDPNSAAYVSAMGSSAKAHADFGSGIWPDPGGFPIGIPYTTVLGTQPKVSVLFDYWAESDPGPYPIPNNVPIEGDPTSGDRHILIVDQTNCVLYEMWDSRKIGGQWYAGSGAIFTLTQNAPLRPAGWTSADAAGLPILPGLVRYDEAASGEINHAIRFTSSSTKNSYIWPARHKAPYNLAAGSPPMGQRFRLKASFSIDSRFKPEEQVILRALKKFGMILADNGSSWYLSGVPDERWNNDDLHAFDTYLKGSDFEAVDESALIVNQDSWQALQGFALNVNPSVRSIDPGGSAQYFFTFQ
ncbi:MAG TPA: hypothetical protein VFK30_16855, partial [Anaerolineae bacterium]|nr:hypothetical protein [Anaerolineae bacterium]